MLLAMMEGGFDGGQDPHFKASTHRRRIISRAQLADYAYLLAPGGMLYTITDVPELGAWIRDKVCGLSPPGRTPYSASAAGSCPPSMWRLCTASMRCCVDAKWRGNRVRRTANMSLGNL